MWGLVRLPSCLCTTQKCVTLYPTNWLDWHEKDLIEYETCPREGEVGTTLGQNNTKHERPVLKDFNTIVGGFVGGDFNNTHIVNKDYCPKSWDHIFGCWFVLRRPHKDDLIVLSFILMRRNIHRVLIDQGSSADVMFWAMSTFKYLEISWNHSMEFLWDSLTIKLNSEDILS